MKAPDKITIGKHNIDHNGDVVFAWIEQDDIPEYVEYIRKDALLEWAKEEMSKWRESHPMRYKSMADLIDKLESM